MHKKGSRILIAGYEIGGQMQLLAERMRKRGVSAMSAVYNEDFRDYQNDIDLRGNGLRQSWNRMVFFLFALRHFKVFHFFWGVSMLSFWRFHLLDLPILKLLGKKIIVHFRGGDIVDSKYYDYLREKARGNQHVKAPPISRKDQKKKLAKWLKYADQILISTPDLHFVSPKSILSPQVIDLNYWQSDATPLSEKDGIIRIVHAPIRRHKKGTDFIENVIEALKAKGHQVELILAEGLPHYKIKDLYEKCDIGIDQVLYGWHGKVSVELMALGKPVICNINPEYRKYRPDLPVIHGDPQNLEGILEHLINDPSERAQIGKQSKEYVAKYHDVEVVVDQLLELYGIKVESLVEERINEVFSC